MPPPDWKSAIEIHPDGWVCPAEAFWVAGWVTSSAGLVPVDVRAWLGPVPFLGLCGLPRPDREAAARGQAGPPHAGFSFLLQPVPGADRLRIEVCDQQGRWTEIFRHDVTSPGGRAVPRAVPVGPAPLLRLLRAQHSRPGESWSDLAREILAAEVAESFDVMPSFPFQGALEEIPALAPVRYDHLLVTGWVAHREQRITALTAFLDTAAPQPLVHGLSRPDAGAMFPELIDGAQSRFAGHLRIPAGVPQPLALRIFADLADGTRVLVFLKHFRPVLTSGAGTDLPPFSRWKFLRAAQSLRAAGWGATWTGADFRTTLRASWQEYRVAALAPRPPRALPERTVPVRVAPLHVTLVTHNLQFEGAPLFLLEYARHLATQPGWTVRVVSPVDGPLRERFTSAGVPVALVEAEALQNAQTDSEFGAALKKLATQPVWAGTEVIIANTMVATWAVHLARQLERPSILYVHESVSARRFFMPHTGAAAIARIEQGFTLATRVAFVAHAAQRAHAALAGSGNFRVLPGWIHVARLRAYDAAHDRAALRQQLGLPPDMVVFSVIGAVVSRKGQHVFLDAIALLQKRALPAPCAFLIVGVKPGTDPYVDILRQTVTTRGLSGVRLIESSDDPYRYFMAADICVCPSLEEALPRVIMEAAVFGRHIVTTDVDGIPELVGPGEAWLVPPDDPRRLADAMEAALTAHLAGDRSRADRAQTRIVSQFDSAILLPRHTDLVRAVAAHPFH
jgi:glycosyltransferase involved in cell wall biosynthesis